MGYSPWGCKESDMTEQLTLSLSSLQALVTTLPLLFTHGTDGDNSEFFSRK